MNRTRKILLSTMILASSTMFIIPSAHAAIGCPTTGEINCQVVPHHPSWAELLFRAIAHWRR